MSPLPAGYPAQKEILNMTLFTQMEQEIPMSDGYAVVGPAHVGRLRACNRGSATPGVALG